MNDLTRWQFTIPQFSECAVKLLASYTSNPVLNGLIGFKSIGHICSSGDQKRKRDKQRWLLRLLGIGRLRHSNHALTLWTPDLSLCLITVGL